MLRMTPGCKVYLALGPADLRNHIDRLALMVEKKFRLDPFENAFFIFCNQKRDKLKILYWDKNGFWLFYRRLELDNNLAERTVKPFVIGRKNWLFCNTPQGADASCIIYSIVETAKLNNLIPYEYMKYLLDEMPGKRLNEEELKRLLP